MLRKLLLFVILVYGIMLSGCTAPAVEIGPKREVVEYVEKTLNIEKAPKIDIISDSSNIEVYTWDKKQVKFEIKKRIRGIDEKKTLEEKLKYFDIEVTEEGDRINYESKYRKSIKNAADTGVDLRLFIPRKVQFVNCKLDIGTIKFLDDIDTDLSMDTNMVNTEIKRLKGKLSVKGDMGNIRLENGKLKKDSMVSLNFGNIEIKAQYEIGNYSYETHTGNIDLQLPKDSKVNFENVGTVEVNEFIQEENATLIKNSTSMGRITLKKY